LSTGRDLPVNFGGAGLMLKQPRTELQVEPADSFSVQGTDAVWIERLVRRWQSGMPMAGQELPSVQITVSEFPPRHFGLGSGTQMALSLASALCRAFGFGEPAPAELSLMMRRGERSSIGTHGFFRGGFLVDRGRETGDRISPLDLRLEFPAEWPIVLILPDLVPGSHGAGELAAFDQTAQGNPAARVRMLELLKTSIVPAIAAGEFNRFSSAIHQFNALSGDCYRTVQGGTWHSPAVAKIVEHVCKLGVAGIIQSSWGPGLAAFTKDLPEARSLAAALSESGHAALGPNRIRITFADNDGATADNKPAEHQQVAG